MTGKVSIKILITVAFLVSGFATLFYLSSRGNLVYYLTVGEFLGKQGKTDLGENFRINGNVVEGSIRRTAGALGARFVMTDGAQTLPVAYAKEIPDTFADKSEVVVEGSLGPDGVFVAHTLLAKCPSKYEARSRSEVAKRQSAPAVPAQGATAR